MVSEWEYGFKIAKAENDVVIIVIAYNNVGMKKFGKVCKKVIKECTYEREHIILVGDMNARIGEEKMADEQEQEDDYVVRASGDKIINSEGIKFLELC